MKLSPLIIYLWIIVSGYFINSYSQDSNYEKELFKDAEYAYSLEAYEDALPLYLQLYKRGLQENCYFNFKIGICYLNIPTDKDKAIKYLEKATKKVSENAKDGSFREQRAPLDAYLFLGNAYRINLQLEKAIDTYNTYLSITNNKKGYEINRTWAKTQIEACKRALNATTNFMRVRITPLSKPINTKEANFNPAISAYENFIVYNNKMKFYDAIMFSKKKKDKWEAPRNINFEIMSDGNQYPAYLSADGKTLLLSYITSDNSDIYISYYDGRRWSQSKPIKEINTKYWESHACLSSDGKTIVFTSNRPQSKGGLDIFYSTMNSNNTWSNPINIGDSVNTVLNEETPFLSITGDTLYFSSQGHESLGGFDVFYSIRRPDGKWSKPVNPGFPFNTTDDDLFFVPTANKHIGYQSRLVKNGQGNLDIVRIEFFSPENPFTFFITGNLKKYSSLPLKTNCWVYLLDAKNNGIIDSAWINDNSQFRFLKVAGNYNIVISSDSFYYTSNNFVIPENYPYEEFNLDNDVIYMFSKNIKKLPTQEPTIPVTLKDEKIQKALIFHHILFSFNQSALPSDAEEELKQLGILLKSNPNVIIEIIGHTDSQGSAKYNKTLSEKRAQSVKEKLISYGASAKQIKTSGKGLTLPIAINKNTDGSDNPVGRAFNRRAEFKIINSAGVNFQFEPIRVPEELRISK